MGEDRGPEWLWWLAVLSVGVWCWLVLWLVVGAVMRLLGAW